MALGDDYVEAAELKSEFGIGDSNEDTELLLAITAASTWVTSWCERDFNQVGTGSETARLFRPVDHWSLMVDDIADTTNLAIKTDEDDDGTFEITWTSTDYQLEPLNQVVSGQTGWPYTRIRAVESFLFPVHVKRTSVEVTANWGWPAIPQPVKKATMILAARLYKRRDSAEGVLAGFADFGPVRVGTRLDPDVEQLLSPYRKNTVGVG